MSYGSAVLALRKFGHSAVAIAKFRYAAWKSASLLFPGSADCRQYDATATYVLYTETIWGKCLVTWYASLVKTNAPKHIWKKRKRGGEKESARVGVGSHVCGRVRNVHVPLVGEDQ